MRSHGEGWGSERQISPRTAIGSYTALNSTMTPVNMSGTMLRFTVFRSYRSDLVTYKGPGHRIIRGVFIRGDLKTYSASERQFDAVI